MAADSAVSMVLYRLPKIADKVLDEVSLLLDADKEVKKISLKLQEIQLVLADAERKGITDRGVKFWLGELQDIAYEIDFAVDDWEVENIRQKFEEIDASDAESDDFWDKLRSSLQAICFCCKQTVRRRGIALDVKGINDRLDAIAQRSEDEFKFIPNLGGSPEIAVARPPNETTSYGNDGEILGRDLEKGILVKKLLSSENDGDNGLQIISMVGTGGMGKTTLAGLVYNEVKNRFDKAMWVYVSDPFDQIKVARKILEALTGHSPDVSSLQAMLEQIEESVKGRKFLLVLDDVWTEDLDDWEPIKNSLQSGSMGSRILVTTRKWTVAKQVMESTYTHKVRRLSDSDCCSVLEKWALPRSHGEAPHMLRDIAIEIAKKCNGMPLAARIVGSLLRSKKGIDEWEAVLNSEWWDHMSEGVFPALATSYQELHPAVKRCFSFCAIFSKGERIEVDSLIRIWMAQGFLLGKAGTMERKGREYFRELEARSLFEDFERDEFDQDDVLSFRIHDVVRGFARYLTNNEFLVAQDHQYGDDGGETDKNVRHLNLQEIVEFDDDYTITAASYAIIRTTLSSVSKENLHSVLFNNKFDVPTDFFSQLQRVKWLRLSYCGLSDIPEEIGRLIHLRLLDLSRNWIKKLPETICNLYNLQTLDIRGCFFLSGLPQKIERLLNLRHILNAGMTKVNFKFPRGFEELTGLQTLERFCCNELGYLRDMNQLCGSLVIRVTTELSELEAKRADLKSKRFLRELVLYLEERVGYEVIESLRPHPNLQTLTIAAQKIPSWLTDDNLYSLRKLHLTIYSVDNNRPPLSLSCLGQLGSLESLKMVATYGMKRIGSEFLGIRNLNESFPKLKVLAFHSCVCWEEWDDISEEDDEENNGLLRRVFPRLEKLTIKYCTELKSLPWRLLRKASSLKELTIYNCPHLDLAAHIPEVRFSVVIRK